MSFGFSVGDFIGVGKLVVDIVSSLKASGSTADYQELVRELEGLQQTLQCIERLQDTPSQREELEALKCAALTCRFPLEEFQAKIEKYQHGLGLKPARLESDGKKRRLKLLNSARELQQKIKWQLKMKKEAQNLRIYLMIHQGNLNMRLGVLGLKVNQEMLAVVTRRHIAIPQPRYIMPNLRFRRARPLPQTSLKPSKRHTQGRIGRKLNPSSTINLFKMPDKFSLSGIDVDMTRFNSLTNAERIQLLSDFSDRFGLALEKDGFALTKIAFRKDRRMMFAISLITIVYLPASLIATLFSTRFLGAG